MILTAGPSITLKEIDYVTDAIRRCHGEHWDEYIRRFEKAFAEYLGVKHAMTTSSCTGALHLGLVALGIGKGDEVIVPDLSWIASASVVRYVGATPVFADIENDSWCIDPLDILERITPKTKAIMPVHLYGYPAKMDLIRDIGKKYGLFIIEDAAPSIGAEYNGKKTGSTGDVAGFSFQGAKLLSTGEGGMLVTNDDDIFEKAKHFAEHGRSGSGFHITDIGFKYKMSNLQAAWGLAQLERIDELIGKRQLIYEWYHSELNDIEGITLNKPTTKVERPIYWMTSIVLSESIKASRDSVMSQLKLAGIDSRPFFPRMSTFEMFRGAYNPVADRISESGINLPSAHDLTYPNIVYICSRLKKILTK